MASWGLKADEGIRSESPIGCMLVSNRYIRRYDREHVKQRGRGGSILSNVDADREHIKLDVDREPIKQHSIMWTWMLFPTVSSYVRLRSFSAAVDLSSCFLIHAMYWYRVSSTLIRSSLYLYSFAS